MATISANSSEKIYKITAFAGLHESPDGDTKLKAGEAAKMRNFMITRDGNLKKRPGTKPICGLLQSYGVADTAETYTTDKPNQLTMYATLSASSDGFFSGTTSSVVTDFEANIGKYWIRNGYQAYKLSEVGEDTLTFIVEEITTTESDTPVKAMWSGYVNKVKYFVAACNGYLWYLTESGGAWTRTSIGTVDTSGPVHLYGFSEKLYILTATDYQEWDGTTLSSVSGYVPLVSVSVPPSGGGTTLEQINKLSSGRRSWFSPDGTAVTFQLPETGFTSVSAKLTADGTALTVSSFDSANGTVTLDAAPAAGTNTVEIGWVMPSSQKSEVIGMRFSELYNGAQDTRVFLYGDGTNKCIYSGLDYNGNARADYFPDMNVLAVGDENTPITAMIRHYSRLIAFKTSSVWAISYGTINLEDGSTIAGFYVSPINREMGCSAYGQARLVLNSPYAPFGNDIYNWTSNSRYTGNLTADERQARRISDRVYDTLTDFDLPNSFCFDDNPSQQYFIFYDGKALVHGYAVDSWYYYEGLDAVCALSHNEEIYFGGSLGEIYHFNDTYKSDSGKPIDCRWESGSLDFGANYMRKFAPMLWIGIKPEPHNECWVTVMTDKKSQYTEKLVASDIFTFIPLNFNDFSFGTNIRPHMYRTKIKAKKFVYYKLIFETDTSDTGITVLAADIKVRFTGQAK